MVLDEWPSIQYFYKLFIQVACCYWKICPPIFHRKPIIMTSYGSYRYTRCDIVEIYNVINFIEDISPVNLTKRTMWVIAVTLHCFFLIFVILRFFLQKPKHLNIKSGNVFFLNIRPLNRKHIHIISKSYSTLFLSCPSITEYSYTQFLLHFTCKFLKTLYTCLLPYAESYINTVVWLDYIWRSYYSFSVRIFHQ